MRMLFPSLQGSAHAMGIHLYLARYYDKLYFRYQNLSSNKRSRLQQMQCDLNQITNSFQ